MWHRADGTMVNGNEWIETDVEQQQQQQYEETFLFATVHQLSIFTYRT